MLRIGIDLGGSKIELIALDDAGRVLLRRRCPTPQGDYHGTLRAVGELVETLTPLAAARYLALEQSVAPALPMVLCDRERVLQVLSP